MFAKHPKNPAVFKQGWGGGGGEVVCKWGAMGFLRQERGLISILNAPKFLKEQCWENFALHHAEFVRGYIHFIHILYTDIARER